MLSLEDEDEVVWTAVGTATVSAMSKLRAANRRLARGNAPRLNREFYSGMPYGYFGQRLENLLLVATKYDQVRPLVDEGFEWGKLTINAGPMDHEERELDKQAVKVYLLLESLVLLHHAAETLLRLYFAHADPDDPPCPWLAMAPRFDFRRFKADVLARFVPETSRTVRLTAEHKAELCDTFRGARDRMKLTPAPAQRVWDDGLSKVSAGLTSIEELGRVVSG